MLNEGASATVMLKFCVAGVPTPLLAVMVPVYVPVCEGYPFMMPSDKKSIPGGNVPVTLKVDTGYPLA